MDDNQLLASRAHHLLFLALIGGISIWSDFGTFGGGQSASGGGSFSRQPSGFGLCHNTGVALLFLINVLEVLLSPLRWDTCHEWCGERKSQNRNPD